MTITILYGCCQIETSTPDLAATRRYMTDTLGAGPIEQELAQEIAALMPGTRYDVDHLDLGQAVFQVNQPDAGMVFNGHPSIHQRYLDTIGPSVTNLNFFIDDHVHAKALLNGLGAATHIEGPSSAARSLGDYGPANTREGGQDRPFLFMGARHLVGLDLEIMEPNFLRFDDQSVQYPAFMPRPATGDGNLLLEWLVIAVESLDAVRENLVRLFAPACRSRPYDERQGPLGKAFRVTLGGIEIEYCEPSTQAGALAEDLARFGQGVVAIAFSARDIDGVLARCRAAGTAVDDGFDLVGDGTYAAAHRIRCRAVTGFDVVVASPQTHSI